jgi:signal transduction histidine kinase
MPPDVVSRMFEPYFTTKDPGKGTGSGLDQVKRFVERSRGAVTVESCTCRNDFYGGRDEIWKLLVDRQFTLW